jgi:hypothetical protein
VEWGFEWVLPGQEPPYDTCGQWLTKGCLNVDEHESGLAFVRRIQRRCHRAVCHDCYESWAGREAEKIQYRLRAAPKKRRPIHLVVSPPIEAWVHSTFVELRRKSYVVSKESGFLGGSCIFHPFREDELTKRWYFSPHFHMIGFGWIQGTKEGYAQHGWVVKNVGLRKTVAGTALYQLSHAGVHKKYHTVTWFGSMSYNNLKIPPREPENRCPECKSKLRPLEYVGSDEAPMEKGDYWLPVDDWIYDAAAEVSPRTYWLAAHIFDRSW